MGERWPNANRVSPYFASIHSADSRHPERHGPKNNVSLGMEQKHQQAERKPKVFHGICNISGTDLLFRKSKLHSVASNRHNMRSSFMPHLEVCFPNLGCNGRWSLSVQIYLHFTAWYRRTEGTSGNVAPMCSFPFLSFSFTYLYICGLCSFFI